MIRAKVSGPVVARFIESTHKGQSPSAFRQIEAQLEDGDLYVHIHLGWKSIVVLAIIFAQSITYVVQEYWNVLPTP